MKLQHFSFLVELTDIHGKETRKVVHETSMHLGGAIRKIYQNYNGANIVRIL